MRGHEQNQTISPFALLLSRIFPCCFPVGERLPLVKGGDVNDFLNGLDFLNDDDDIGGVGVDEEEAVGKFHVVTTTKTAEDGNFTRILAM